MIAGGIPERTRVGTLERRCGGVAEVRTSRDGEIGCGAGGETSGGPETPAALEVRLTGGFRSAAGASGG